MLTTNFSPEMFSAKCHTSSAAKATNAWLRLRNEKTVPRPSNVSVKPQSKVKRDETGFETHATLSRPSKHISQVSWTFGHLDWMMSHATIMSDMMAYQILDACNCGGLLLLKQCFRNYRYVWATMLWQLSRWNYAVGNKGDDWQPGKQIKLHGKWMSHPVLNHFYCM